MLPESTVAAEVSLYPQEVGFKLGVALHVTLPGFYAPGESLVRAGLSYLEQFAAYDPAAGAGAPRVVADFSAITGTSPTVPGR